MSMLVLDPNMAQDYIRQRRASGNDRWDEVWEGVYVLIPNPNIEHQDIATSLAAIFKVVVDWTDGGRTFQGVNVSDQADDWTHNYRCPDVAVYRSGNPAIPRGASWQGGPDFAVEISSPPDRAREKLDFYARVGVTELLIVDRDPWALELYRRRGLEWDLVGASSPDTSEPIASVVLPLTFRLVPAESVARPAIEVIHPGMSQAWTV